jgi:uncharacterized membrane protein YsdA (DUF1294 family)
MELRIWALTALFVWNVVVFTLYARDKYKAKHDLWRTPEKTLLLSALVAGGIGALIAGKICHHKTRKWYFWLAWIVGLTVDVALLVFVLTYK